MFTEAVRSEHVEKMLISSRKILDFVDVNGKKKVIELFEDIEEFNRR